MQYENFGVHVTFLPGDDGVALEPTSRPRVNMSKLSRLLLCAGVLVLGTSSASAHTIQICWRAETNGTVTMFAGSYHANPGVFGSIIIDGTQHLFTGSVPTLPSDVTGCQVQCEGSPGIFKWQTTNISVPLGVHSVTTTATSSIEDPWPGCYPANLTFGGIPTCPDGDGDGTCDDEDACPADADNDADGDGVCGDVDVCAGTVLPEGVPMERLGTNRFADTDGDGTFNTALPGGVGPKRSYTIADTGGCSCEQIIDALELGNGHRKFGCSISAMDDWLAHLEANALGPYLAPFDAAEPHGGGCAAAGGAGAPAFAVIAGALFLIVRRRRTRR